MEIRTYTDLLELYATLTTPENATARHDTALKYCTEHAPQELAQRLQKDVEETDAGAIRSLVKIYKELTANGKDGAELLYAWERTTAADVFERVKQALNIPATPPPQARPAGTLEAYLQRKIKLIPSKDKKPLIKYVQDGAKLIEDAHDLQQWQARGVTEYGFIPSRHNLLVIDLDRGAHHANQTDGIQNFIELVNNAGLSERQKRIFADFPSNFPCYTETQSGGLHLYFKASYITPEIARRFDKNALNAKNIELKYNEKVTAAGSVYNGKPYTLHGTLEAIPEMTFTLLEAMTKEPPKPAKKFYRNFETQGGGAKWNARPETIIEKANALYSGYSNHDFIYRTAVLFHNAGMDKATAERYIMQTPQHMERTDKADTQTAINSIYRGQ